MTMTSAGRSARWGWWLAGAILLGWSLLVVVTLRGCMNQHSRPVGHGDITLDVSPTGNALVFNAQGDGTWDLYTLDLATSEVRCLARTANYEITPRFSPDGKDIVYAAAVPGDRADHIFIRSITTGEVRQLTSGPANDTEPRFAPDGSQVVFVRDSTYIWGGKGSNWSDCGAICAVDRDGQNFRQLTSESLAASNLRFVSDSVVEFDTLSGRFRVPADGSSGPTPGGPRPGYDPATSRDGRLIAFTKGQYAGDQEIYVANADGTSTRQVTDSRLGSTRPVFSPAGDKLYFLREDWPNGPTGTPIVSLWVVSLDGKPEQMLFDWGFFVNPRAANQQ